MTPPGLRYRGQLVVGSRVIARVQLGVCDVGALGYDRGLDSEGYSILFASGRHDGFSPDEISQMIQITDECEPSMVGYQISNVTALSRDYERGCFRFFTSD